MGERRLPALRRREIADAALKVIAEQGLGRFTARAVAREIGVTDAALFHHFRTMQEVVLAAIDRVEELLFADFPPEGSDALARLERFFHQRVAVMHFHPGAARLILSDQLVRAAPPAGVRRAREFRRRSVDFIRACLKDADESGLLAEGLTPDRATVLVLGALMVLTQARELIGSAATTKELAVMVWGDVARSITRGRRQRVGRRALRA